LARITVQLRQQQTKCCASARRKRKQTVSPFIERSESPALTFTTTAISKWYDSQQQQLYLATTFEVQTLRRFERFEQKRFDDRRSAIKAHFVAPDNTHSILFQE